MMTEDIRDIKGVLGVFDLGTVIFLVICLIVLLGILFLAYRYYQQWQAKYKKLKKIKIEPEKPFQELAEEQLLALDPQSYFDKGDWKNYYFAVTEIVRIFLAKNYIIETLDRTSWEIIQLIERVERDWERVKLLDVYFQACDLVKFAKYKPTITEMREARGISLKVVKECFRPNALR